MARLPRHRAHPRAGRAEARAGFWFALPWIVGLTLFTAIPLVLTFALAFAEVKLNGIRWAGLANYEAMWRDADAWRAARNTLVFAAVSVPLKLLLALGLALVLDRPSPLAGLWRTLVYLPFLMPAVASTIVFTLLLAPGAGPVNVALDALGLSPPDWLRDPRAALWTLVILSLWPLGVETLVFLGGLQSIPREVKEAAALDSPRAWHRLVFITLPMLGPVLLFNLVIGIIASFQVFTQALVLGGTTGAPAGSTLMFMVVLYRAAFRYFNIGYAAALATVLFAAVVLVLLLVFRAARSRLAEEGFG